MTQELTEKRLLPNIGDRVSKHGREGVITEYVVGEMKHIHSKPIVHFFFCADDNGKKWCFSIFDDNLKRA